MNRQEEGNPKDVRLQLAGFTPPPMDPNLFRSQWEDDPQTITPLDTAFTPAEQQQYDLSNMKTLRAAIVKAWKNPRHDLDAKYTTGFFSGPALYVYDLRNDTTNHYRDVFLYLGSQNQRLYYDRRENALYDPLSHPINYFVDEVQYFDPYALHMLDVDRIAYIKILETDFLTPRNSLTVTNPLGGTLHSVTQRTPLNVCIYTKKGKDFRTVSKGMNTLTIKGYDEIFPFHPDQTTLYRDPAQTFSHFTIKFNSSPSARRFRLKIEGISAEGKPIQYETVIE